MNVRVAAVVGVGFLPWSVVVAGSELTFVFVVVGLTQVTFAWGFSRRLDTLALPVGALVCWAVVWWFDLDALGELLT